MKYFVRTYKRFALISFLIFCVVWNFVFGAFFSFDHREAKAAAVTWVGGVTGTWETGSNWSTGVVPTNADDITIASTTANVLVTLSSGQTATFNTLTVGGDATYFANLILIGNVSTSGAANGNMTIATKGTIEQKNTTTQTIAGTLLVQSGGLLTHADNSTTQAYEVDVSAANISVNSGGFITADGKGYDGGAATSNGYGPGAGIGASTGYGAGGAGHCGAGGNGNDGGSVVAGGSSYCDISSLTTMGSGAGSAVSPALGGAGGGFISLAVSGTLTLNGSISATGTAGITNVTYSAGGGAGGGIKIVAGTVAGTPQVFSVAGGNGSAGSTYSSGGGAGGGVYLEYTVSNSVDPLTILVKGGAPGSNTISINGGAGVTYVKQNGGNTDLYAINALQSGATSAESIQTASSITADSLTVRGGAIYTVTSSKSLILNGFSPFIGGQTTSTVRIAGGTFTPNTTLTVASTTLEFWRTSTLTASTSIVATIADKGIVSLGYFSTSTPALQLSVLTVQSGGIFTHMDNSSAQTHIVNVSAATVTVNSGGFITADGKGYDGGASTLTGYGPGAGTGGSTGYGAGGAGHCGAGGSGNDGGTTRAGGSSYCDISNLSTMGSGAGSGASPALGGAGGGFISLAVSGTLTLNGSISATGTAGITNVTYSAGGGAGGGIKIVAGTVAGTPQVFSVAGGNGSAGSSYNSGGGGGGGVNLLYTTANSVTSGMITISGGTAGASPSTNGSVGLLSMASANSAPTVSQFTPVVARDGSGLVTVTTTVADADSNTTTLFVDFSVDSGSTWASSTIFSHASWSGTGITAVTGTIFLVTTSPSGRNLSFYWGSQNNSVTSTAQVKFRIRPYDGTALGSIVSSTEFTVDNVKPTTPGNLTAAVLTTSTIRLSLNTPTSTDTNFLDYRIHAVQGSSVSTSSPLAITSSTDANLANSNYSGATSTLYTTTSSPNTQFSFFLAVHDTYGNSTTTTSTLSVYTLATTPGQPTVGTSTASTLTVTLGSDTNTTSTQYAIYNTTAGTYINSLGAATGSPVYQTKSTWGSIIATSLTGNTLYQFNIIARNGDSVTTTFSASSTAIYILASTPSGLAATVNGSQVALSWAGNGTSYKITRSDNGATSGWISGTSYTFSSLSCGTTYTFSVIARNGDGVETSAVSLSPTTSGCGSPVVSAPIVAPIPPKVEPVVVPKLTEPVKEEPKTEEPIKEVVKKPIVKKEEIKKTEQQKEPIKQEQTKTEQQKQEAQKTTEQQHNQTEASIIEPVQIGDAGVKVVKEGALLKVTNDRSVQLLLDTNYQKVTIQDDSGRIVQQMTAQPIVPWELSGGDGQKCITATFYDAKGNLAKQKVTCVGLDTTPPPPPKVKGVDTKLQLEQKGKIISVRGTSEPNTTIRVRVRLVGGKTSIRKVKTVLREWMVPTVHAATEGYVDIKTDAQGNWSYTFPEAFDEGAYEVEAVAEDEAGNVSQPVKTSFGIELDGLDQAVKAVRDVINNPEVERINETLVAPSVIGIGVVNMAASGSQLPQVLIYLKYLFGQPLLLLRRKKHKTWGTVYNAFTKQPVDLATVRLVLQEGGNVVRSQVTDVQGRYYLFGEPGTYRLEVDKNGYSGISDIVKDKQEDGAFTRVYHGDGISIGEEKTEINYSIPLEPIGEEKPAEKLIRERVFQVVQQGISLTGVGATGISFIISPELKIAGFFCLHLLFYAISYKFTHKTLPESFGTVRSAENKKGLHNVVVRIFDSAYNKLVTTLLTDRKGRYAALVGPSIYYVAYEKPGYEIKKSGILNYSSQKTQGLGGMIIRDEELKPGTAPVNITTKAEESRVVSPEKISVMPQLVDSPASVSSVDSTSLTTDMPETAAKKPDDRVDNPDDLIAQWKENH